MKEFIIFIIIVIAIVGAILLVQNDNSVGVIQSGVSTGSVEVSGATSTLVVSHNSGRQYLRLTDNDASPTECTAGSMAISDSGSFILKASGTEPFVMDSEKPFSDAIYCIGNGATSTVNYLEY